VGNRSQQALSAAALASGAVSTGSISPRWAWSWVCGALLVTIGAALYSGVAQQAARRTAEDAPRALLTRTWSALTAGQPPQSVTSGPVVDLADHGSPFVVVYDSHHRILAADAVLAGTALVVPAGVLDTARDRGEDAVTWQPAEGVREAVVARPWSSATGKGVVVAGASLAGSESRTADVRNDVATVWALGLLLLTAAVVTWRQVTPTQPAG
jgi:hypothetical protein